MKNKKADITLETIVIAALVLVVLVILIFIAYKYIWGGANQVGGLSSCQSRGGLCSSKTECDNKPEHTSFWKLGGCPSTKGGSDDYCCIPNKGPNQNG